MTKPQNGRAAQNPLERPGPTTARITMWLVGGAVGVYMVASGVIGALTAG